MLECFQGAVLFSIRRSSLNLSSSTMLMESLAKELNKATISFLVNFRSWLTLGSPGTRGLSNSPENKILRAVPSPVTYYGGKVRKIFLALKFLKTCNFPQSLHLSQPTQSMTRVMFLKCSRNSTFSS